MAKVQDWVDDQKVLGQLNFGKSDLSKQNNLTLDKEKLPCAQHLTERQKVRDCHAGFGKLSFVYAYLTRPRFGCPIRYVDTAWG